MTSKPQNAALQRLAHATTNKGNSPASPLQALVRRASREYTLTVFTLSPVIGSNVTGQVRNRFKHGVGLYGDNICKRCLKSRTIIARVQLQFETSATHRFQESEE